MIVYRLVWYCDQVWYSETVYNYYVFQEADINFVNVVSNWFDICDDWFGTYVAYCRFGGVTVCNFVYCDKNLGNQIIFARKVAYNMQSSL